MDGKKVDMRCYVLIACNNPYFVLYHQGYMRKALEDYFPI